MSGKGILLVPPGFEPETSTDFNICESSVIPPRPQDYFLFVIGLNVKIKVQNLGQSSALGAARDPWTPSDRLRLLHQLSSGPLLITGTALNHSTTGGEGKAH